ncbi:MAG: flavodoxin-dependent (E)-4-hydroxy-3-methylbut-2-enyl-diphosphate synthase [bacterium]
MSDMKTDRGTRVVRLGDVPVGGSYPVVVQSMTNTPTRDSNKTLRQIRRLYKHGCEIVRVGVPDHESAEALHRIVSRSPVPVVADIHFDHTLALEALEAGVAGLRLNPGNIRSRKAVDEVIKAAGERRVPIRVGVNAGSLPRDVRKRHRGSVSDALVESAMEHIRLLENADFSLVKVSLKAADVMSTVEAYRKMRAERDYPLHLGITEAGTAWSGLVKSSAGLAILLADGIGDTIRVSLAADPVEEVRAAYAILRSLGLRRRGVEVVACPTCARARLDVLKVSHRVEKKLSAIASPLTVAVMGCAVNGPGEARLADLGCVGTDKGIQVYVKGERKGTVPPDRIVNWLYDTACGIARDEHGEEIS